MYRGSEAYDISLFEPRVIEQPKKQQSRSGNTGTTAKPRKKAAPQKQVAKKISPVKDNAVTLLNNHQVEINREEQKTAIPVSVKKALCFVAVCVSLLVVLLVMDTRCDELIGEIATMENQIAIAKGENVRLNAELSSMVSTDKIESYAEDVLGMVKAENYQISYIDLSGTDEILVSGDKSVGDSGDFSGKIKELIAYIF